MDKPNLDRLPAASIAVMLLWVGVSLYREPTLVKRFLIRRLGPAAGGALYALLLTGGATAWWALWRATTRYTVIPELKQALRSQPQTYEAAGA